LIKRYQLICVFSVRGYSVNNRGVNKSCHTSGILPQQQLQDKLKVKLEYSTQLNLEQLETELPIAFYSLLKYWQEKSAQSNSKSLNKSLSKSELENFSISSIINSIPRQQILRQQLTVSNHKILAELIALVKPNQLFLLYLQLLPRPCIPLVQPQASLFYRQLLTTTTNRLCYYAIINDCDQIITDIYNPNLLQHFRFVGFKSDSQKNIDTPLKNIIRLTLDL